MDTSKDVELDYPRWEELRNVYKQSLEKEERELKTIEESLLDEKVIPYFNEYASKVLREKEVKDL